MSLHKICAHAALSLALVSSATSQAFNLQMPQLTGKQMIGTALTVASIGAIACYFKYGKKSNGRGFPKTGQWVSNEQITTWEEKAEAYDKVIKMFNHNGKPKYLVDTIIDRERTNEGSRATLIDITKINRHPDPCLIGKDSPIN